MKRSIVFLIVASSIISNQLEARSGFGGGFAAGAVTGFFAPMVLGAMANGTNGCNGGCNGRPSEVVVVNQPPQRVVYESAPPMPQAGPAYYESESGVNRARQAELAQVNRLELLREENRREALALQRRKLAFKERKQQLHKTSEGKAS